MCIRDSHSCTYEVVSEGVSAEKETLQNIPISQSKWWSEQILAGKPILLDTLEQLPEAAADEYKILAVQGIRSLMVTPLMTGDHVWGYMGIDLVKHYPVSYTHLDVYKRQSPNWIGNSTCCNAVISIIRLT